MHVSTIQEKFYISAHHAITLLLLLLTCFVGRKHLNTVGILCLICLQLFYRHPYHLVVIFKTQDIYINCTCLIFHIINNLSTCFNTNKRQNIYVKVATQSCIQTHTMQPHNSLIMDITLPPCGEIWHAHQEQQEPDCVCIHSYNYSVSVSPCFMSYSLL